MQYRYQQYLTDNPDLNIMSKVRIKQVRSTIKCTEAQKRTIQALGLGKINRTKEVENTPQIAGMITKVAHLVEVENI